MVSSEDRYVAPGFSRRSHKWAMCAHKGGRCVACDMRVTHGNILEFDFDHKTQINNPNDKTDRWSGAIRDWPPFTDKWFAWAETVDLICVACHRGKHRPLKPQLTLDLSVQERLARYDPGPALLNQSALF